MSQATTTKAAHTPTPWTLARHNRETFIIGSDELRSVICEIRDYIADQRQESDANAQLIVTAVNHHAELIALIRRIDTYFADTDAPLGAAARTLLARLDVETK